MNVINANWFQSSFETGLCRSWKRGLCGFHDDYHTETNQIHTTLSPSAVSAGLTFLWSLPPIVPGILQWVSQKGCMMHQLLWDAANIDTGASQACTCTTQEEKPWQHTFIKTLTQTDPLLYNMYLTPSHVQHTACTWYPFNLPTPSPRTHHSLCTQFSVSTSTCQEKIRLAKLGV